MEHNYLEENEKMSDSLIQIATEFQRFEKVFSKVIGKLNVDEQSKYESQFAWFSKRVMRALNQAGFTCISVENEIYDPGMAVTPLNLDEFAVSDTLVVEQMIEPIIMKNNTVVKTGTVLLRRSK